jgi:hypothetical protein
MLPLLLFSLNPILRCGIVSNLSFCVASADFRLDSSSRRPPLYAQIIRWFVDHPSPMCPFSLHAMLRADRALQTEQRPQSGGAEKAGSEGSSDVSDDETHAGREDQLCSDRVGTWFGPHHVCRLLQLRSYPLHDFAVAFPTFNEF